ncbi:MAG: cysteine desulfurase family protein [Eubacteriales bacterium]
MDKEIIYLDNSATTRISECAKEKMAQAADIYGNPSSLHAMGSAAERIIRDAKTEILLSLGVRAVRDEDLRRLCFTSCGTEATNLALFGTAYAKKRREATRILTTDSEHPSVENSLARLAEDGFEIVRIPTRGGVLDTEALNASLDKPIFMASFMLVNNETGALYNVREAFGAIRRKNPSAVLHCDAVQGYLKVKFTPESLGADLVTLSAHKIHGPKGIGALYIAPRMLKERRIAPYLCGGGQEYGMRSGTENVIGIAGFGAAVREVCGSMPRSCEKMRELRDYTAEKLSSLGVILNRPSGESAPHILNLTLPDIKSQTMLNALSERGIYVSSGSACSSHSTHPSKTLISFGLTPHEADCSLRISFSEYNTKDDCDRLISALGEEISKLVRIRR